MHYQQDITLNFSFPVIFERDIFARPVKDCWQTVFGAEQDARAIFFVDEVVAAACPKLEEQLKAWSASAPYLAGPCPIMTIPAGESAKSSFAFIERISKFLSDHKICRHSYVIIIGGGATLDAVGFAASITHRGIRQIRIPTTVLAQDDSAVGVKNGINYFGFKNFLGTFYPPFAVINDSDFLLTLGDRDWIAGVAEAFKVAIIKDRPFFEKLEALAPKIPQRDREAMEAVIQPSAKIHMDHIRDGGDPFEMGSARPLDFGHWSAHKLEALSQHALRHGEAVAIGIGVDLFCAEQLQLITKTEVLRILTAMQTAGLPLWSDFLEARDVDGHYEVLNGLDEFREHIGGQLTLTMPNGLGARVEIHELSHAIVLEAIDRLKNFTH